jgi:CheY-like chemotaxis protein
MPVMDGEEAARRVRKMPGGDQVKIVAVTASAFKEEHKSMLAAGMDEVVSKPYRFNEIYDCMARHLGLKFISSDTDSEDTKSTIFLKPFMLEKIEDELQMALREALRLLDRERITQVIQHIGEKDQVLADSLQSLVDDFNYPAILKALDGQSESDDNEV